MSGATRTFRRQPMPWIPLPYMRRAVDELKSHYRYGLPLKPGGRKTSITLKAFAELQQEGKARTMLVVAPKRVARQTWRQEGEKWDDFRHLTFATVIGDEKKRRKALSSGADIYLINYENLMWLSRVYAGRPLPFDVTVFDELTKMQNSQSERSKAVRPRLPRLGWRWGLTGSLFAKGHMSIFGQQLVLDDGAALGKFFTHYRDAYFTVGFTGFDYALLPGGERRITERIAPYWFYMDDSDYAQLPPQVDVPRIAEMEPQQRELYNRMKKDALIAIGADTITAANAGAVYSKLAQLANGAIYREGHTAADDFLPVHDLKLDMLEELLDELDGEPLIVAYEFQHDLQRIQERFGPRFGGKVPYLGAGTTDRQEDQWVAQWNARELPLLLAHPQSAGHGLNMQEGQAFNVAWYSVCWDWELYDQFVRRVRRSGNNQARIFNHLLLIRGTIDEEKLKSVTEKDFTERRLETALKSQLLRESQGYTETETMVAKLDRPGQGQVNAPQQGGGAPSGWGGQPAGGGDPRQAAAPPQGGGAPAGWGGAPQQAGSEQRERIQEQIAPSQNGAGSAFSGGVQGAADRIASEFAGNGGDPAPAKRTRKAKDPEPAESNLDAAIIAARSRIIAALVADPDLTVAEIIDFASQFMEYVVA